MAFLRQNLSRSGHQGNAFPMWHFRSNDDLAAAIQASGYFNEAKDVLENGNYMIFTDSAGVVTITYVTSPTGQVPVTVATGLVVTA